MHRYCSWGNEKHSFNPYPIFHPGFEQGSTFLCPSHCNHFIDSSRWIPGRIPKDPPERRSSTNLPPIEFDIGKKLFEVPLYCPVIGATLQCTIDNRDNPRSIVFKLERPYLEKDTTNEVGMELLIRPTEFGPGSLYRPDFPIPPSKNKGESVQMLIATFRCEQFSADKKADAYRCNSIILLKVV